jgi:Fe2+ transport system protein FeoA
MAGTYLTCPLCGFEFEKADTLCHHGCPLGAYCNLARCPVCEYEFPERLPSGSWLRRLFRKKNGEEVPPIPQDGLLTVVHLDRGERAEVLCLGGDSPSRRNNLAVFGLVPGSEIRVIQRQPSFVIRVGETILALEEAVARDIVVRRYPAAAA